MDRKHKIIEFIYREGFAFVFGASVAVYLSDSLGLGNWAGALFSNRLAVLAFVIFWGAIGIIYRRSAKQHNV